MLVTFLAYKIEQSVVSPKMCFSDSYVHIGVLTKNFNNFHYFSHKNWKFHILQCKTSIRNNSGSMKDRVVKFAYSMGFAATADQMV